MEQDERRSLTVAETLDTKTGSVDGEAFDRAHNHATPAGRGSVERGFTEPGRLGLRPVEKVAL